MALDIHDPVTVAAWFDRGIDRFPQHHRETVDAYESAACQIQWDLSATREAFRQPVKRSRESDPYADSAAITAAAGASRAGGLPFEVSDVNHGHPIWSDSQNFAFRAHHDACHVLSGSPAFTYAGEVSTYLYTIGRLRVSIWSPVGQALLAEIVGQSAVYETTGEFPTIEGRQAVRLI